MLMHCTICKNTCDHNMLTLTFRLAGSLLIVQQGNNTNDLTFMKLGEIYVRNEGHHSMN